MQIDVTTVYTKKRILRFNYYVARQKKLTWAIILYTSIVAILLLVLGLSDVGVFAMSLLLIWNVVYVFINFVLPLFTVNRSNNKNITIHFSFTENEVRTHVDTGLVNEAGVNKYEIFVKLAKNGNDLYLFTNNREAFVVDVSALDAEQLGNLKVILASKLSSKKFNWK